MRALYISVAYFMYVNVCDIVGIYSSPHFEWYKMYNSF